MKNSLIFCLLLLSSSSAFSQEIAPQTVYFETLPTPNGVQPSGDPSIPQIGWYRWTTKNFSIHSIDKTQGEYLFGNIEQMKSWCLTRWGLPDADFTAEARIFCATSTEEMKKLFNIDSSFAEVREEGGKIKISYLWLVNDVRPAEIVPPALTVICMKEFEKKNSQNIGWYAHRGMAVLNETLPQIRRNLGGLDAVLQKDSEIFFSKSLFQMTEADWKKQTPQMRQLYDNEAAVMCLLIRKEFGQKNFQSFLRAGPNVSSDWVLGFKTNGELDATFKRYMFYLVQDIKQNKTPDTYLQIVPVTK